MKKLFEDCIDEGIQVYQGRTFLGMIRDYEAGEGFISKEKELDMILEALTEAKKKDPNFQAHLIIQDFRFREKEALEVLLNEIIALKLSKKEYDDIIIGFDLVGDETLTQSKDFADTLHAFKQRIQKEHPLLIFNYFLHAGESTKEMNDNIIDNLLLQTPRIGHGINLIKNLHLLREVKNEQICIETNPLSNQILNFIPDLRHHPLKAYLNFGVRVSISSDDDGIFGTDSILNFDFLISGLSMDFNLFDYKQVALNSLNSSGISREDINIIKNEWFKRWEWFIFSLIDLE